MIRSRQREESLFEAALELPREQRGDYLSRVCADDPALRARIEALLAGHEQTDGVLDRAHEAVQSTPRLRPSPPAENPGDRIGPYKLLQQIGEGGCGVVWMAEQETPVRRRVALKVIKLGMDTRRVVARFEAERQALALMEHPNIAKVLDAGATETGRPFFVMELVRGIKITDFCEQHQFTTGQRLALFAQVCQAVQHAHQKGIIHRDLKPSNILVADHDGVPVPKVIDFGIAKATTDQRLTDKTMFTAFEQFLGTPAYMSPEQANFSGLDVDTRSDIYSLGVLLYELLTGTTPFDAQALVQAGLDEMRRTIREVEPMKPSTRLTQELAAVAGKRPGGKSADAAASPRRLQELIPLLRGDLDWIVMKCLEKDRSRRYATANGLAMDVRRYLQHEPVNARPPTASYRLQKLAQRNRLAFAVTLAVGTTLLIALISLLVSNARTIRERNQKTIALQEKAAALEAARTNEQRAREELFTSLKNQARARRYSRQMGQRLESLAAVTEAARLRLDATLRDEAIAAFALPDLRRGPSWPMARTNCVVLTCDALGQRYALLDRQGIVTVRSIADNQEIHRFETESACAGCYTRMAFSPGGRFLAKAGDDQPPRVWSLESGQSVIQGAVLGASSPTFSADRRHVALAGVTTVYCYDLQTGRESSRWEAAGRLHLLQFHPTNDWVAIGYKQGPWASVHEASSGREIARLEIGDSFNTIVSWHPDGRHLAIGGAASGIQIWDVSTQRRVMLLTGHAPEVDYLTFHPSGDWLASWTWDGVLDLWEPTTGRQAMHIPLVAELQFSHDGRWLGFFWPNANTAQLLEFVPPPDYSTLPDNSREGRKAYNACALSPDDRFLAVAMNDGVRLWNLAERRQVALLPSGPTESVFFTPDGRTIWTCAADNGVQRWTLKLADTNSAGPRFDPPQRTSLPFTPTRMAVDQTVRTLAVVSETAGRAIVLDLTNQSARSFAMDHPAADFIALSPDGKWLATSGWRSDRCRLWDAASGRLVKDWVVGAQTKVGFTPDSRELIAAQGGEFQFLNTTTLAVSRQLGRDIGLLPGTVAFSAEGKLMAMELAPAVIQLRETATGRTVAQLEDPFGDRSDTIMFSHAGTRLIVLSPSASAIHVWDLPGVRSRLRTLGLDWDRPELR